MTVSYVAVTISKQLSFFVAVRTCKFASFTALVLEVPLEIAYVRVRSRTSRAKMNFFCVLFASDIYSLDFNWTFLRSWIWSSWIFATRSSRIGIIIVLVHVSGYYLPTKCAGIQRCMILPIRSRHVESVTTINDCVRKIQFGFVPPRLINVCKEKIGSY